VIRTKLILLSLCLSTPAIAEDPYQGEGDNSFGPYETNAEFTTGDVAGFRSLHASADIIREALKPTAAKTAPGVHILELENTALSSVDVVVNGTKVGVLGPLTIGRINDVGAGEYKVTMHHPNGFAQNFKTSTVTAQKTEAPEPAPPAEAPEAPAPK